MSEGAKEWLSKEQMEKELETFESHWTDEDRPYLLSANTLAYLLAKQFWIKRAEIAAKERDDRCRDVALALGRATKAVCRRCASGDPVEYRPIAHAFGETTFAGWYHRTGPCDADAIRSLSQPATEADDAASAAEKRYRQPLWRDDEG
jgi:hypothetical protein